MVGDRLAELGAMMMQQPEAEAQENGRDVAHRLAVIRKAKPAALSTEERLDKLMELTELTEVKLNKWMDSTRDARGKRKEEGP